MPTVATRVGVLAGILAGYALLAILHTYPLVRHLDTHLPGQGLGDNASFLWNAWWMRVSLASSHEFFWNPLIAAPIGASLALHTHSALSAFLAATVLAPLPLVRAHNLVLLASLALNGLAACSLAHLVTRARAASVLAGALFVVAPTIAARLMGHYNLVVVWPLVFACAACVAWWHRPTVGRACAFAAAAALVPYADYYYTVFLALFVAVYGSLELWAIRVDLRPRSAGLAGRVLLPLGALLFAIGVAIAVAPTFEVPLGFTTVRVRSAANVLTAAWGLTIAGLLARWRPWPSVSWRRRLPTAAVPSLILAGLVFTVLVSPLLIAAWRLYSLGDYVTQTSSLKSSPRGIDLASLLLGPPFSGVAGATVRHAYAGHRSRRHGGVGLDRHRAAAAAGAGADAGPACRRGPPVVDRRRRVSGSGRSGPTSRSSATTSACSCPKPWPTSSRCSTTPASPAGRWPWCTWRWSWRSRRPWRRAGPGCRRGA